MTRECDKQLPITQFLERCTICTFKNCATNDNVNDNKIKLKGVTISCIGVEITR